MLRDLTAEEVRAKFSYDPQEGLLRHRDWSVRKCVPQPPGAIAGGRNKEGYRNVMVMGRHYRASRVIWLYMTGEWPEKKVDHIDLDTGNDKWENLREATDSQQKQNNRKRKDSGTGYKCVTYYKDPRYRDGKYYRWQVVVNGKRIKSSQRWLTAKEAHDDYCSRLEEFHGEFANNGAA